MTLPALPSLQGGGFSLALTVDADATGALLEAPGLSIEAHENRALAISLDDGKTRSKWTTTPRVVGGSRAQVTLIFDGGPNVISVVKDGVLCDGGDALREGWGRFSPELGAVVPETAPLALHPAVSRLLVFDRALRSAEAATLAQNPSNIE